MEPASCGMSVVFAAGPSARQVERHQRNGERPFTRPSTLQLAGSLLLFVVASDCIREGAGVAEDFSEEWRGES